MSELSQESVPAVYQAKQDSLEDLRRVGPDKPLGYLSIPSIGRLGSSVNKLSAEAKAKGLETILFPIGLPLIRRLGKLGVALIEGGALFVYDKKALSDLLTKNSKILSENKWPTEPKEFIIRVADDDAPRKTALFDVVADSFADYTNPLRLKTKDKAI